MIDKIIDAIGDLNQREIGINSIDAIKGDEMVGVDLLIERGDDHQNKGTAIRCWYDNDGIIDDGMADYYGDEIQKLLDRDYEFRIKFY